MHAVVVRSQSYAAVAHRPRSKFIIYEETSTNSDIIRSIVVGWHTNSTNGIRIGNELEREISAFVIRMRQSVRFFSFFFVLHSDKQKT